MFPLKRKFFSSFKSLNKCLVYFEINIPNPHPFVTESFHCDISQFIADISALLPQFSDFITQFNNVLSESGINVITDSSGNMSIEVPKNMPDSTAKNFSTRIGIIDRLITTRGQEINDLFQKGTILENKLRMENPNHVSELAPKIEQFKKLN